MKKTGFTLVELLGVIVILALILAIAIPAITSIIDNARANAVTQNSQMMIRATRNYMASSGTNWPTNIGDTIQVRLIDLQNSGHIGSIKSPSNNQVVCNGYVLVTRVSATDFAYNPSLNCQNNIGSVTEDNLIARYTFDDFQEPTTNLLINPSGDSITNPVPGSYTPGWDNSLHSDAIRVATWDGGYNGGVTSPNVGYHAKWVYKNTNNTDPVMMFIDENNTYSLGHRWLGIAENFNTGASLGITTGQKLTVSWNQKANILGKGANVGLYHALISTGLNSFESNISQINVSDINTWQRVSYTTTVGADWDLTKTTFLYVYGQNGNYGRLWVDDVQVEKKSYATPFVSGSRTGIVKDCSSNNNHATLQASSTPKWVSTSQLGGGAYEFNGTDSYVPLPATLSTVLNNSNFTLSTWVKSYGMASGMTAAGITGLGYGLTLSLLPDGNLMGRIDNGTTLFQTSTTGYNLHDNKYHFVTTSFDGNYIRLYIDGEKAKEITTAWSNRYNNAGAIGYDTNNPSVTRFFGLIDDVRIYKRALSDAEIKQTYQTGLLGY